MNAEEGIYYCFGCQASGDAITFVRATEHLDFVEAVRRLADRAGITITEDEAVSAENRKTGAALQGHVRRGRLVPRATSHLARRRDGTRLPAVEGVRRRAGAPVPASGGPPTSGTRSRGTLRSGRSCSPTPVSGSSTARPPAGPFRARVLFPIFDPSGRAVAIGGRVLPGPGAPRRRPPSTRTRRRRRSTRRGGSSTGSTGRRQTSSRRARSIVCEGYTDVIGFFSVGLPRAVATCGTALGEEHFRLLRNFATGRVVLAYDADAAGAAGASRVYSGNASTRWTWRSPRFPQGATRASWPGPIPKRSGRRSRTRSRFSPSGSLGYSSRPT